MARPDVDAWEEPLVADMRAHDGHPTSGPLAGHPLMLMTATGARTGEPRRAILTYSRQGGVYVVAGTAGGSPTTPAWVANVRANPDVTIEIGARRFQARARVVPEAERAAAWDEHVRQLPWFAPYPEKSGRLIPVIRLTPSEEGPATSGT
ncbi:MAG TPA: nitroreductase/quinone reductase family protein [Candidatus Limnocylindrales bacterium]|nr:nitroreductase/quinone reductase family protein [Candidatus Limnocylindrales bacterium]